MKFLIDELLKPLSRRIGTSIAGMVGALNVLSPAELGQVEVVVTMLAGVSLDLVLSGLNRRQIKRAR